MKTQRADTEVRAPARRVLDPRHAVSWMQAQRGRIRRFVRPFTLLLAPGDGVRLMDNHRVGTEVRVAAVPSLAGRVAPSVQLWMAPDIRLDRPDVRHREGALSGEGVGYLQLKRNNLRSKCRCDNTTGGTGLLPRRVGFPACQPLSFGLVEFHGDRVIAEWGFLASRGGCRLRSDLGWRCLLC
jgi:hypothetical protein